MEAPARVVEVPADSTDMEAADAELEASTDMSTEAMITVREGKHRVQDIKRACARHRE